MGCAFRFAAFDSPQLVTTSIGKPECSGRRRARPFNGFQAAEPSSVDRDEQTMGDAVGTGTTPSPSEDDREPSWSSRSESRPGRACVATHGAPHRDSQVQDNRI